MEKYRNFAVITERILDGELVELDMKYIDIGVINVIIIYKYNDFINLSYEVEVNANDKMVKFLNHGSYGKFDYFKLDSDRKYEKAVSEILFS